VFVVLRSEWGVQINGVEARWSVSIGGELVVGNAGLVHFAVCSGFEGHQQAHSLVEEFPHRLFRAVLEHRNVNLEEKPFGQSLFGFVFVLIFFVQMNEKRRSELVKVLRFQSAKT
jgi:hypothetical protein